MPQPQAQRGVTAIPALTRRSVLRGLVAGPSALVLVACSPAGSGPDPTGGPSGPQDSAAATGSGASDPDQDRLDAAAEAAGSLLATCLATMSVHGQLADQLSEPAEDHTAHLAALVEVGATDPRVATSTSTTTAGAGSTTDGGGSTAGPVPDRTDAVPADPVAALEAAITAETAAAEVAATDAEAASQAEVARLLASIAASRAGHALRLAGVRA